MRLTRSLGLETTVAALVCFLWPSTAWANPIIPPIVVVWPAAWILLAPVVFVEAAIAVRVIGTRFGSAFWLSCWANLLSTVVGVPIGTCFNPLPLRLIRESESIGLCIGADLRRVITASSLPGVRGIRGLGR